MDKSTPAGILEAFFRFSSLEDAYTFEEFNSSFPLEIPEGFKRDIYNAFARQQKARAAQVAAALKEADLSIDRSEALDLRFDFTTSQTQSGFLLTDLQKALEVTTAQNLHLRELVAQELEAIKKSAAGPIGEKIDLAETKRAIEQCKKYI